MTQTHSFEDYSRTGHKREILCTFQTVIPRNVKFDRDEQPEHSRIYISRIELVDLSEPKRKRNVSHLFRNDWWRIEEFLYDKYID